jgi:membrane-associated protease RseP (regulator of RpoE activity)
MGARFIASSRPNKLTNYLELACPPGVETLNLPGGLFVMTPKKLALIIGLMLGVGLIAGGIVYAQQAAAPEALLEAQDPLNGEVRGLSFMIDGGPFLGVSVEDISKENMSRYGMREVRGVGVTQVVKDSPAEKAGLRKDDVILRFEGESVTSARKLTRLVGEASADQTVRLTISRGGSEQEISATLAKHDGMQNVFSGALRPDIFRGTTPFPMKIDPGMIQINPGEGGFAFAFGNRRIGVSTQPLTKQLADYFGVKDGGLLITSVNDNSPAAKAGLKAGDVITAVDGEKVTSPGDVSRAISKKEDGPVSLTIFRDRNTRTVTVTPEKNPERTLMRPGTIGTRRIVIPSIQVPAVPEMNIQIPRIAIPATPQIDVTVPRRAPRVMTRSHQIII